MTHLARRGGQCEQAGPVLGQPAALCQPLQLRAQPSILALSVLPPAPLAPRRRFVRARPAEDLRARPAEDLRDRFPGDLQPGQPLLGPASRSLNRAISPRSSSTSRRTAASRLPKRHGAGRPISGVG